MPNRSKSISTKVGSIIRALRMKFGYTQNELAKLLYKSESTVRMWELSKSEPDVQTINAMAELFGVSTDYILGNESNSDETSVINDFKLKVALFGNPDEVTDEMWQKVLDYAKLLKLEHDHKKQGGESDEV